MADGDDGKLLVHCFAGCDPCDGPPALRSRGLLDDRRANGGAKPNAAKAAIQFTFEYRDPVSGEARYRKIRREYADGTKSFFMEPKDRAEALPCSMAVSAWPISPKGSRFGSWKAKRRSRRCGRVAQLPFPATPARNRNGYPNMPDCFAGAR